VFSVVLSLCLGITPAVIVKLKTLQNQTVFVISTLFSNEGCENHPTFVTWVPASKKVGNLCSSSGVANMGGKRAFAPTWKLGL